MADLLEMIEDGSAVEAIYEKYGPALAARMVMMGITTSDAREAITLIKEIHDRSLGKAKERQEVTYKYKNISDEELEKMISAEEEQVEGLKEEKMH